MVNREGKKKEEVKCWEVLKCTQKDCPAYQSNDPRCWLLSGTHCRDEIQGKFLEKMEVCLECKLLKVNIDADTVRETIKIVSDQLKDSRKKEETLQEKIIEYEKLSALGRLTANVAHEIRNPLTVIGGLTERLKKSFVQEPKQKEYLDLISLEVRKLEEILKDVLIFSNKAVFKRAMQDIHQIINDSLNAYKDKCENIHINRLFGDVPQIYIDEKQVRFAIDNLISNAIDAMHDAGTLTLSTTVEHFGEKNYVALKVMDTGVGISEDKLAMIFEPFFTTKTIKQDEWLGLPITRKIVEGHGGLIKVDSVVGKGSTFALYFPYRAK
jgi:signal transduction histidine kinase